MRCGSSTVFRRSRISSTRCTALVASSSSPRRTSIFRARCPLALDMSVQFSTTRHAWKLRPGIHFSGTDPLVLVAMSSTFQDQIGCLQRVVDALRTLQVRGLVTTGLAFDAAALQPPPNVTVVPSAPHRQVLQHAALVITHGGHGTVVKALAADVPMVLLPHGRDQADTATRVTERGAGITLKRTAGCGAIASAVGRVLQNGTYRAAAQRLGDLIRRDARSHALVRELEEVRAGSGGWHCDFWRVIRSVGPGRVLSGPTTPSR
jgi:UDP:flavonoid glycosyltransferase YjiC (YdhE family)